MKSHLRIFLMSFAFLFAVQVLRPSTVSAAPLIAGSYKITENTDLGSEIRLTVQLDLFNPGTSAVTISNVAIRSISSRGQMISATQTVVVQSHSTSLVSLQFLIPKKDFEAWYTSPQQQFLVTLTPSTGKTTLVNVPLLRTQG